MSTHTGCSLLNSCVKMPIDPCSNCPAPIYNRPKQFMGKQKTTTKPSAGKTRAKTSKAATAVDVQSWPSTGIRSLAKFYDSIPDYCDVKHLHKDEFYSTLETLRTTSRELRTQAAPTQQSCASTSSNSLANLCGIKPKTKKRASSGKGKQKKSAQRTPSITPTVPATPPASASCSKAPTAHCMPSVTAASCLTDEYNQCLRDFSRLGSFKHDFAIEVADFKRTLKSFEKEFKCTEARIKAQRPKSTSSSSTQTKQPAMHTAARAKCRREMLRRCYSVNDLGEPAMETETPPLTLPPCTKSTRERPSNYFPPKFTDSSVVPEIQIETPLLSWKRSSSASSSRLHGRRNRAKSKTTNGAASLKPPIRVYELHSPNRALSQANSSASPVHPVARPNLAATLRAEVSRKKVKELRKNCTYHDETPQFDWEVRKTPAWKSLSLNEPHKALLSIRLATRKAEQELQERQYEMHMQMMRQRVKSAPLLLEGPTYWGTEVGKLTHSCHNEGMHHACDGHQQRKQRISKKKCGGSTQRSAISAQQQLCKIYGGSSIKSCSRQSKREHACAPETHDSGDDLCSVDRAFL